MVMACYGLGRLGDRVLSVNGVALGNLTQDAIMDSLSRAPAQFIVAITPLLALAPLSQPSVLGGVS